MSISLHTEKTIHTATALSNKINKHEVFKSATLAAILVLTNSIPGHIAYRFSKELRPSKWLKNTVNHVLGWSAQKVGYAATHAFPTKQPEDVKNLEKEIAAFIKKYTSAVLPIASGLLLAQMAGSYTGGQTSAVTLFGTVVALPILIDKFSNPIFNAIENIFKNNNVSRTKQIPSTHLPPSDFSEQPPLGEVLAAIEALLTANNGEDIFVEESQPATTPPATIPEVNEQRVEASIEPEKEEIPASTQEQEDVVTPQPSVNGDHTEVPLPQANTPIADPEANSL